MLKWYARIILGFMILGNLFNAVVQEDESKRWAALFATALQAPVMWYLVAI